MFYNILHFIAHSPALTELGFIFSRASNLVSRKFKGFRRFGGPGQSVPSPLGGAAALVIIVVGSCKCLQLVPLKMNLSGLMIILVRLFHGRILRGGVHLP